MTGAVAAMAEPPQIDEPTPTRIDVLEGTCNIFLKSHAIRSEVEIVQIIIGNDCFPVSKMTPKFIPKPNKTTAVCRMILEVHLIPGAALPFSFQNIVIIIPARIEITAPPITGNCFPSNHDGIAITKHTSMPYIFFLIVSMIYLLSFKCVLIISLDYNNIKLYISIEL